MDLANVHHFPCGFHGVDKVGKHIITYYDGETTGPKTGGSLRNKINQQVGKKFECPRADMTPLPAECNTIDNIFETDRNDTRQLNILASGDLDLIFKTNLRQSSSDGSRWIEIQNGCYRLWYFQQAYSLNKKEVATLKNIIIALQRWYPVMWQRYRSEPSAGKGTAHWLEGYRILTACAPFSVDNKLQDNAR